MRKVPQIFRFKQLIPALVTVFALTAMLAAASSAGAAISAGNTGWSWANPLPQGNSLSEIEVSGGRAWVGGATGTLLHSDDGGRNWNAVRTGLLDEIRTIDAITPYSVVFAGKCALRRTDDSGITVRRLAWGSNDDTCSAQIQAIDFATPLLGYLLLTNGDLYTTGDGGESWKKQSVIPGSKALGGPDSPQDLAFTGASEGVVSIGNKILQTTDAGVSWTPVETIPTGYGQMTFEFVSPLVGYSAGKLSGVYKTVDGGATWNAVAGSENLSVSGISCSDEQHCVAAGGFVISTDNGWTTSSASDVTKPSVGGQLGAVSFVSGKRVIAVGVDGLMALSDDGGVSWSSLNGAVTGVFRDLRTDGSKIAMAWGHGGTIARSTDGGATWSQTNAEMTESVIDAVPLKGSRQFALGATGKLYRSVDGGAHWTSLPTPGMGEPHGLAAWSGKRVALIGPKGVAVADLPKPFKRVKGAVARLALQHADVAGKSTFAYGTNAIAKTANNGKTWSKVGRPRKSGKIVRLDMLDARFGYLLDNKAELFVTKNGGKRWRRIETTGANVAVSMAFGDKKHGYLTDNTGRVLATSDGGATWARQYPFYDATGKSNTVVAATSRLGAVSLVPLTNKFFSTTTMGRIGKPSVLTIKPSATKVRSGTIVRVTGKLSPATGIEQVTVLARVVNAKGGTQWVSQQRPVSATGTFTSPWKITATTEFIARWSGDASHDGDAAPLRIVRLRK